MATKKSGGPNKSAFIRQHPDAPASEVVLKGKAQGLSFSPAFVFAVRSKVKAGKGPSKVAKPAAKGVAKPAKAKGKPGRKPKMAGKPSASEFVRSMPQTMKAGEVVLAAKKQGIKMSTNLVYMVRSVAKKKAGGGATRRGRKPGSKVLATGGEATFRKLAFELGIGRARQLLAELEQKLRDLLAG